MLSNADLHRIIREMYFLNLIIIIFYNLISVVTAYRIVSHFQAYSFFEGIGIMPQNPWRMPVMTLLLYFVLLYVSVEKNHFVNSNPGIRLSFCIIEMILCALIIEGLNYYYSGIALVVLADLVNYVKGNWRRAILMVVLAFVFVLGTYGILPFSSTRIPFASWINYYAKPVRVWLLVSENILISENVVLFIYYMVQLFTSQKAENERISGLNKQLKQANLKLRDFALELERMAEIRERNRLAREIHDTLGHTLTKIVLGSEASLMLFDEDPAASKIKLEAVTQSAREGLDDIRASIEALRPDSLKEHGLDLTLREMIAKFQKTTSAVIIYEQLAGKLEFALDEEDTLYRIIQECMTNSVRHGHAGLIRIMIRRHEDVLTLDIRDDGSGCEKVNEGFGLRHMQERLELLSGSLTYGNRMDDPQDGNQGFYVIASLPVRKRNQEESYD